MTEQDRPWVSSIVVWSGVTYDVFCLKDTGGVADTAAEPIDVILCTADISVARKPFTVECKSNLRSASHGQINAVFS